MKPIEEIEVGDKVLAYDEETGKQAYKPVVRLFRNETKEWYHVFADGEEIVCTGGHPFYVVGVGFVEARNLKTSDKLLLSNGKEAIIEKVEAEQLAEAETTYNFEVQDFHTYYVTEKAMLVHNKCVEEMQMTQEEAIKYGKEFLGDGFQQVEKGVYHSADGLRSMRFDFTHHPFRGTFYSGNHSPAHINLYSWKVPIAPRVRNKLLQETIIWFL